MVVINRPVNRKIEDKLDNLRDEFAELKTQISEVRKTGKDTSMAEVLTLDFNPKLTMARVTYEKEDIKKLQKLLDDIRKELKEAKEGSIFDHANELIKDAYEKIRDKNYSAANASYNALTKIYKDLPHEQRRVVYVACLDIKKKIEA
jgi:hypothetical protein